MTNDIFCVGLTRTELQTLGTLLYSPDGSMCALRGRQPNARAVLRHSVPYKGLPPLAMLVRLSQRTLRRKQSSGADHFRRRV